VTVALVWPGAGQARRGSPDRRHRDVGSIHIGSIRRVRTAGPDGADSWWGRSRKPAGSVAEASHRRPAELAQRSRRCSRLPPANRLTLVGQGSPR